MIELMVWVVSMVAVLLVWEANYMGLDWYGLTSSKEWTKWGIQKHDLEGAIVPVWSFRIGPLEIFKMV